jgi:hypothetical protein
MARGSSRLTKPLQTPNTEKCNHGSHTAGDKVRSGKGNSPDRQLRSQNHSSVENDVGRQKQPGGWLRSSHPLKKA